MQVFRMGERQWDLKWMESVSKEKESQRLGALTWLSSYTECCEVLNNTATSSRLEGVEKHLLFMDPPEHTVLRNQIARALPSPVGAAKHLDNVSATVCAELARRGEFDLVQDFAVSIAGQVACRIIGIPKEDVNYVVSLLQVLSPQFDLYSSPNDQPRDAGLQLIRYFLRMLRNSGGESPGLFRRLAQVHLSDALGLQELLVSSVLLTHAAFENSANFLAFGGLEILGNSKARASILSPSMDTRLQAVDELLRLATPARIVIRRESRDESRKDLTGGCYMALALAVANRDQHKFKKPNSFDLARPKGTHLAFGFGPHACLGARFARMEGETALRHLAQLCIEGRTVNAIDWDSVEWKKSPIMFGPSHAKILLGR